MDDQSERGRRSRKSAPIKNNSFMGAKIKPKKNSLVRSKKEFLSPPRTTGRRSDLRSHSNERMRFSTPIRGCETVPRVLRPRKQSGSTYSITSTGSVRKFHPKYDPTIEIRRAKERYEKYTSKDWNDDMFLDDDASKDLSKYEEKCRIRQSNLSRLNDASMDEEPVEIEKRISELRRRQRDIDRSKITEKYQEYVFAVPKPERLSYHPQTPNKFRVVSRRAWDGMIKKWRKHLHNYEDRDFSILYRSDASSISGCTHLSDFSIDEELPEPKVDVKLESVIFHDEETITTTRVMPSKFDDDDTLQGCAGDQENVKPKALRRSLRQKSGNVLSPDLLHSGLTNDMHQMYAGQKRVEQDPFPSSPNKRLRSDSSGRSGGVLAHHGPHVLRSLN